MKGAGLAVAQKDCWRNMYRHYTDRCSVCSGILGPRRNSQETQRAACENRAGKFRDDVLELTGGLGKTQENFSAKEFLGHPKGRA